MLRFTALSRWNLGADYMGELSRLSELTRFTELTRFLLLFPIISTLRLLGKRVVPLSGTPVDACRVTRLGGTEIPM